MGGLCISSLDHFSLSLSVISSPLLSNSRLSLSPFLSRSSGRGWESSSPIPTSLSLSLSIWWEGLGGGSKGGGLVEGRRRQAAHPPLRQIWWEGPGGSSRGSRFSEGKRAAGMRRKATEPSPQLDLVRREAGTGVAGSRRGGGATARRQRRGPNYDGSMIWRGAYSFFYCQNMGSSM